MLVMFIVSISVTTSVVFFDPFILYSEGHKNEGIYLFKFTIGFLMLLAIIVSIFLGLV